jgi:hypothetical protein
MTIAANDFIDIDRQNGSGTGAPTTAPIYGTTANTSNVTQITSRTTGVTINAPVGSITLLSAANSATDSTFTVTNSFVAVNDVVLVTQQSGTDPRRIAVTATAAGSFNITSASISGTTTESPIYNFVVIKAAIV